MFRRDRMTNDTEKGDRIDIREEGNKKFDQRGFLFTCEMQSQRKIWWKNRNFVCLLGVSDVIGSDTNDSFRAIVPLFCGNPAPDNVTTNLAAIQRSVSRNGCMLELLQWLINNKINITKWSSAALAVTITITNIFEKYISQAFSSHGQRPISTTSITHNISIFVDETFSGNDN